jgi:hypothetical protein
MVCRSASYKYGPLPLVTQTGVVSYHKLGRILDGRYEMSIVGKSTINVNDETASITPPFSQRTQKIMIDRVCFKFDISRAHHFEVKVSGSQRRRAFARCASRPATACNQTSVDLLVLQLHSTTNEFPTSLKPKRPI